jgi:hypothetical protein
VLKISGLRYFDSASSARVDALLMQQTAQHPAARERVVQVQFVQLPHQ